MDANKQLSPPTLLGDIDKKSKKRFDFRSHSYLIWCMVIPAVIMYLIYLSREIHPFGDESVLVLDLNAQYVYFFEALRKFVYGDASLLYSFSRALGGEFMGMYAYYIASPFSYIVCLFPETKMLEALLCIFLLKTAICGGTFGYYMHKTSTNRKKFSIVVFSILYALSSYAVVQQHNTMWIDAVMWLPLITLGIEEVIKHGKFKLYTIFLAITLFSNFYIGYMVCVYCLLYFFYYYFANNEDNRNNPLGEKRHLFKSLLRMAVFSLIAIGIAMVILLSAYYALNFGKTTFSDPNWEWYLNFDILELIYKFLPGSYDTVRPEGYPFVYCGLLTLLLVPAYFLSPKNSTRQKIFAGIFIFIFVASFFLSITDLIWHGFQRPNWLNYRYSFMLCFFLCVLACRSFADFERVSLKATMVGAVVIGMFCVYLQKYTDTKYVTPDDFTCIWFTLLMLFVYMAILTVLRKEKQKELTCIVLLTAICIEVFLNGLWNMNSLDKDVIYSSYSSYNSFLEKARPITKKVQESDLSFYRMEKTMARTTNDNMALSIRGLSGSTSTLNKETIQFLNKMGYSASSHWAKYLGGTPVNDSLLGIKYIVSDSGIYSNYYEEYATHEESPGYVAYRNPYALSLAYGVSDELLNFEMGFTNAPVVNENQNNDQNKQDEDDAGKIGDAVNSLKDKINEWLDIDETINSSQYIDHYNSPFERLNAIVTAMLGEEETVQIFVPISTEVPAYYNLDKGYAEGHACFNKKDTAQSAYLTYVLEMPADKELYFYLPSNYPREVDLALRVNSGQAISQGTFFGGETSRIISLGNRKGGDSLTLTLTLKGTDFYYMMNQDCFYYIDWTVFEDAMARLSADQYQITKFSEDSFEGTFTASRPNELVLSTLAYDKGWKVYVDGKEVETTKALGALTAFYVDGEAGQTHTIKIKYMPNTFIIGTTVSVISLGVLLLVIVFENKLKKRRYLKHLVCIPTDGATVTEETTEVETGDDLPKEEDRPSDEVTADVDDESVEASEIDEATPEEADAEESTSVETEADDDENPKEDDPESKEN